MGKNILAEEGELSTEFPTGFSSPAEAYLEEGLDLNKLLICNPSASFFVKVEGDGFENYNIYDGDLLIVDRAILDCSNVVCSRAISRISSRASLALVIVNEEFVFKRIFMNSNNQLIEVIINSNLAESERSEKEISEEEILEKEILEKEILEKKIEESKLAEVWGIVTYIIHKVYTRRI